MENTKEEKREADFKYIYKKYFQSISAFCYSLLDDRQQGLDITQDSFHRLWERWNANDYNERSILSFLYTIARNLCYDAIKCHHQTELLDEQISKVCDTDFFLDELTKQETKRHINEMISKLSRRKQEIIKLSLSGKSINETAEILQISVNTIKSLKKKAYAQLKITLKNDLYLCILLLII